MDDPASAFWNLLLKQILQDAGVSDENGLSGSEAEARLRRYGPNDATDYRKIPLWLQFLAHFRNPLVIMLLVASLLSMLTGDTVSFVLIVAMVLLSVIIDFFQEVRAENGVNALRRSVATEKSSGAKSAKRGAARPAATPARRNARTPARRTGTRRAG